MPPSTTDYIPLATLPYAAPPHPPRTTWAAAFLRRRNLILCSFLAFLLTLFALLQLAFRDYDADLDYLDYSEPASQTSYLPFQLPPPVQPATVLQPVQELPDDCLEAYYVRGDPCYTTPLPKLDFVWTWVNGSDPLQQEAKIAAAARFAPDDPWRPSDATTQARLYRDHDELRHSMRSVLAAFRPYTRRFTLLTADFAIPNTTPNLTLSSSWRLGQVPQWLNLGKQTRDGWADGSVELRIVHHAQMFETYSDTVFNSLAIESQLANVPDVADHFVYMNDDLYFARPMSPASFYTSAYGIVLHLEPSLVIPSSRPTPETPGEWRGMGESNYLLSERFGRRHRPYVMHEAKIVSRALLAEARAMFPESFARSATHHFRETAGPGAPSDVNTLFMHAHFIVERAREAMLWVWAVARVGSVDDAWGAAEARRAWEDLGGSWVGAEEEGDEGRLGERELLVRAGTRRTLEARRVAKIVAASGAQGGLGRTTYVFSSQDGYAYGDLGWGKERFPSLLPDTNEETRPQCKVNFDWCFAGLTRASDVFTNIAFNKHECGDCVISALMTQSGELGMGAVLPDDDRRLLPVAGTLPAFAGPRGAVHLPLAADWQQADFTLRSVLGPAGERSVRLWAMRLLQRYRYVIGSTPATFERLENPEQAQAVVDRLSNDRNVVLVCVNDDVEYGDDEVAETFIAFQERHWGRPAAWEKQ
ncbi:hypothetical protein WOLCODRAFT_28307 [Wolfiporia cocos MD-104 SS10]|uniref:Stealth protein CR3 conserved region 3 domain-containing protein n=1 Tax=Wolfiporia cocos (strain MD-104) TaxID=742152 RepID=A0A2H3JBB0_WOLCO|nr:hypothetical protein WOLCODRAFT_28307 [Wolfiporia cocos MD-104 SS10]